jgi:amino acid transporter
MKKTVLTFGLIGGVIISTLMLATVPFAKQIGFDRAEFVGYTVMLLSFLMVFFGIRSYRDNIGNGYITFGRAFAVGALITLITSLFYVITWEVVYFKLMPNFVTDYTNYLLEKMRAAGETQQAIDAKMQQMRDFKQLYDNPLLNPVITLIEPLPVGLLITLISSLVLRKRGSDSSPTHEPAQRMVA